MSAKSELERTGSSSGGGVGGVEQDCFERVPFESETGGWLRGSDYTRMLACSASCSLYALSIVHHRSSVLIVTALVPYANRVTGAPRSSVRGWPSAQGVSQSVHLRRARVKTILVQSVTSGCV